MLETKIATVSLNEQTYFCKKSKMHILIIASEEQKLEILRGKESKANHLTCISRHDNIDVAGMDALFFLDGDLSLLTPAENFKLPVFINSVIDTLTELQLPPNFSRINGWNGFLERDLFEIASGQVSEVKKVFDGLGWRFIEVKDEPGLVAARIIAMIINEAHYALEENLSTINEIDLAMKNGTNYPYGPFEWLDKIGIKNIYSLLEKLSVTNKRYEVAPLLARQAAEKQYV